MICQYIQGYRGQFPKVKEEDWIWFVGLQNIKIVKYKHCWYKRWNIDQSWSDKRWLPTMGGPHKKIPDLIDFFRRVLLILTIIPTTIR